MWASKKIVLIPKGCETGIRSVKHRVGADTVLLRAERSCFVEAVSSAKASCMIDWSWLN